MTGPARNLKAIFSEAIAKVTSDDLTTYLDEVCGSDGQLRSEIESLVAAHRQAGVFLHGLLEDEPPPGEPPIREGPGTVIGRYKLLEKIGEGGMAVVYMAEQTEPIRRKVALKVIKLGMDTRQVIARFEAERQALALMDHPCIAKVHDAGATLTGRPYFVMELVTGVSITEYCDKNNLSTKDRLALFVQVCNAVQHAHQKGIIHRDIKPSNVMVTHHDGRPVPRVIDFGIAKATNQRLTEKTLFTRYAHLIGTPAYMSPEQAELSDLDVDTRTDIYSLGVLLYELLTGTTPFSEEELRKAGYIEMQRVIREKEPAKPSTKLTTLGETLTDVAKHRGCTPDLLRRAVRGDLDWIVMKSLEKDRAQRYETASSLAEEIRRHLEHEPVLARGPSTTYRLRKFLRRHRVHTIAALVMAAVVVAVSVILSMWNRDRLQLVEAEGFKHRGILSQAREQYAKADREATLETVKPILDSKHVGPDALLLQATVLGDNRRPEEAVAILKNLLDERPEIAGAAHSLLARILWESESPNAEKLKEIEEHRRQAEALLPETAEAYFLRAMMAVTIREQLASLDKALQLDPRHYESRRLRAFTDYASRKYEKMRDDALAMTIMRDRDPLGYSLRAIAFRELGKYQEAIAEYDRAIVLTRREDPQYVDLSTERSETLLRMGEYERVIGEVPVEMQDLASLQYHVFSALTALGDYDAARALFHQIVHSSPTARNEFWFWVTKYVFDTLEAGRSWHSADREPAGAAFLPMIEAEETYRGLSAKGRRITTNGFNAQWSPDGSKLAFSLGVRGRSGVAIYNPATTETELLILPGKNPMWSPDGQYIAFVRDCQALRLEELTATDRKDQERWATDEELWLMKADGTEPRGLARGGSPSWGKDSTQIYFHSHADAALCRIPIAGGDHEAKRIMPCPSYQPSVSPDNQHVAYLDGGYLKVKDLASQAQVAEWRVPFGTWSGPTWSPTGKELCLGAGSSVGDRTGLWIYHLDANEPVKVLSSQIMAASWAPDATKLVFGLRPPYFELWSASLDPATPTIETLGPGQTLEEHWQDMLRLYTHRMQADPQDAHAYSDRARYYDYRHERAKADADMKRWTAIVSGRSPSDSLFGTPRDFRHVIGMPFNCELVFSAERPLNAIPMMSIAFGQKGRCEMKLLEIPMVITSLLGLCFLPDPYVPAARADFYFGTLENLGPVINTPSYEYTTTTSVDGLELYFISIAPGGYGGWDIWVSTRQSVNDLWGPPSNLGPTVNSFYDECFARLFWDGLTLYFSDIAPGTPRPGGLGGADIWMSTRATRSAPWGAPVNAGTPINSSANDSGPSISCDGLTFVFGSDRAGGYGDFDLWMCTRPTVQDPWGAPVDLGPDVNSGYAEFGTVLSADGLALFFCSDRAGGVGSYDAWMTTRKSTTAPWGPAVNLGPAVNSASTDGPAGFSGDMTTLYLVSDRPGGFGAWDVWQTSILPVADLNGDGAVDGNDMALLANNWGQNEPLCDIGPSAWGDGIVDEKDLMVLMERLMTPAQNAADVPCDVVLSWASPEFVDSHDVYFGTSFDDVNSATREDPCGVLVSDGQMETTYDPEELLEFSQTYYWRVDAVDVVLGSLDPTIYRGPVLSFTTEAYAYPIQNIVATASSSAVGTGPEKTVDGSGLDENDGHSTNGKDMWQSKSGAPQWIQFEFDKVYTLHELWVWNSNSQFESLMGLGARNVTVEYSTDGTAWTTLDGVPEFAKAPGAPGYKANTIVSFGGISAKYVKLTIEKGWGTMPVVGLSEVRFFNIPDRSSTDQ